MFRIFDIRHLLYIVKRADIDAGHHNFSIILAHDDIRDHETIRRIDKHSCKPIKDLNRV